MHKLVSELLALNTQSGPPLDGRDLRAQLLHLQLALPVEVGGRGETVVGEEVVSAVAKLKAHFNRK